MNRLVKLVADENKYYPLFLVALVIYALFGAILFAVCVNYAPNATGTIIVVTLSGAFLMGIVARIAHNLCYAKVMNDETNAGNKSSV